MNKRIKIITGGAILAVTAIIAGTVSVVAIQSRSKTPAVTDNYTVEDKAAVQQMYYETDDGEKIALEYYKSLDTEDGGSLKYYLDKDNNQYAYDETGELISYIPDQSTSNNTTVVSYSLNSAPQTEADIQQLARQYVKEIYGETYYDKLTLTETIYSESMENYDVYFDVVYKDKFVTESCIATLNADGSLSDVSTMGKGQFDEFDPVVLNEIKITDLEQYVGQWLEKQYGESISDYQLREHIYVIKTEEGYGLSIPVGVTLEQGEDAYEEAVSIPYSLT